MDKKVYDLHTLTAAEFFGIKPQDVTPEQRDAGKSLNYIEMYSTKLPIARVKYKGESDE